MAHIPQSRPGSGLGFQVEVLEESGLDFQVEVLKNLQIVPSSSSRESGSTVPEVVSESNAHGLLELAGVRRRHAHYQLRVLFRTQHM